MEWNGQSEAGGRFAAIAYLVRPIRISRVIELDPYDDQVLAHALATRASAIVSGDRDLLFAEL